MLDKDRTDKLTWLILNHVISAFGLRMRDDKLIYMYRLPPDGCKNILKTNRVLKGGDLHIIPITSDLTEVFHFVNLDRDRYEQGFDTMFDYNSFMMKCSYLTRIVINSLENGVKSDSIKTDENLCTDLRKFLIYLKLSHEEIKDNDIFPAMLYYNIKEDIVRNFFCDEELEEKFKKLKRVHLFKNELAHKFNAHKIVGWIPALNDNPTLIDMFGRQFIKTVTEGKVEKFPDYLVDSEEAEIRREALFFYEYDFLQTAEYKLYIVEGENNEHVIQ